MARDIRSTRQPLVIKRAVCLSTVPILVNAGCVSALALDIALHAAIPAPPSASASYVRVPEREVGGPLLP